MICPSILSADFSSLKETLSQLKTAGIKVVHFDVMDNHFVPNLTFGHKFIEDLRKHSDLMFDTHLMIDKPEDNITHYIKAGADLITVHYEATAPEAIALMSRTVRSSGKKFGLSIKPATPAHVLTGLLPLLDLILVMTVEPGFGGQPIIEDCIGKISSLKKMTADFKTIIQVDGGVNKDNISRIVKEGADWLVVGSAFFKEKDYTAFNRFLS